MEPHRPDPSDRPPVEVLEGGHEPGAVEQRVRSALQGRWGRAAAVALALALGGGAWWAADKDPAPAQEAGRDPADLAELAAVAPGLRPPPARGPQPTTTTDWQVPLDVRISSGPRGHTVTFFAVNRGDRPQDPSDLRVEGGFVDEPDLTYTAECGRVRLTAGGYRPQDGSVAPGKKVFVRCTDTTAYLGRPAWIDPKTVLVRTAPCESEGTGPGV